jgi:ankyrin repeat protein
VSVFSWADTLAETETDNEDERGVLSKALIMAIGTRIPKEVKLRLKDGDSVLACDPNECNALHYAVKAGGKRVLTELLKCKEIRRNPGGVNIPDREGETPLHLAVRLGKTELVLELLNARADVNALDRYGRPPLERALGGNRDDIVEVLLKHKADESLLIHERKMDATIARRLSQVKQIIKSRS